MNIQASQHTHGTTVEGAIAHNWDDAEYLLDRMEIFMSMTAAKGFRNPRYIYNTWPYGSVSNWSSDGAPYHARNMTCSLRTGMTPMDIEGQKSIMSWIDSKYPDNGEGLDTMYWSSRPNSHYAYNYVKAMIDHATTLNNCKRLSFGGNQDTITIHGLRTAVQEYYGLSPEPPPPPPPSDGDGWNGVDYGFYVGVGANTWKLSKYSAQYWIDSAKTMSSKCSVQNTPFLGLSIGGASSTGKCSLRVGPKLDSDPRDPYIMYGPDKLTSILKKADEQGVKVFLGVEPMKAKVKNLIDILANRADGFHCVMGFMVDMEWVLEVPKDQRETLIQGWYQQVRSKGDYKLYLVGWIASRLDEYRAPYIVYMYDGQGFDGSTSNNKLNNMFNNYLTRWSTHFAPNDIGVYWGYNSDQDWQPDYTVRYMQNRLSTVPYMKYVLIWTEQYFDTICPP
jgi:hypothetical protein